MAKRVTSVYLSDEVLDYVDRHSINLSDWVEKKLQKEIKNYGR